MVIKFKFESEWGQREAKAKVRENSIYELLVDTNLMEWLVDKFMRKSERIVEIEIKET